MIATIGAPEPYGIAVYTGSSLAGLTQLGCQYGFPLAVQVQAGTQRRLPARALGWPRSTAPVQPRVAPPVARYYFYPFDPSVFDSVSFNSQSYDPASSPLTQSWDFGDGSSASGPYQQHRYTADGDYQVTLTVTTTDGRRASANQTVSVRTHDVSVLALDAPRFGKLGKGTTITVAIGQTRTTPNLSRCSC